MIWPSEYRMVRLRQLPESHALLPLAADDDDRMQSDEFLLTQEFLAMMLGVQRTGVTAVAGTLQRAGLIGYQSTNLLYILPD
jgi:CRP-like cAMP-binding protein